MKEKGKSFDWNPIYDLNRKAGEQNDDSDRGTNGSITYQGHSRYL
jgi:hypothetical protein